MATLIPEISFSELKKLKSSQLRQSQSFEVISDGVYLCTVVVPQTDYVRVHTEYLAQLSNAIAGTEPAELQKQNNGR